jgi:hypothetical protein
MMMRWLLRGYFLRKLSVYTLLLLSLMTARIIPAAVAAEKPGWQAEWDKAIAGAKKEGAVYLWGDMEITHPDIVARLHKRISFYKTDHGNRTGGRPDDAYSVRAQSGEIFGRSLQRRHGWRGV